MYILASASPRRKELLGKIIDNFMIVPSTIDESTIELGSNILEAAEILATKKALDVKKKYPDDTVIGADTIIVFNDEIYGKPKNKENAKEMLHSFSNNTHYVITGVCIASINNTLSFSSINEVTFYNLSEEEIEEYLKDNEYTDKAGSYAIQGKGSLFIKEIKGDYNSIVGLPISQINRILKNFFKQ